MSTCVIVLNWRNAQDTLACLDSLLRSEDRGFSVVVCDNGSGDGSMQRFLAWGRRQTPGVASTRVLTAEAPTAGVDAAFASQIVWVDTGANRGFAGGVNVGLRLALARPGFEHVWVLNNDCIVHPAALGALKQHMRRHPDVGICGARLLYLQTPQMVQAWGGARHNRWTGRTKYLGHLAARDDAHDADAVAQALSYVAGASMFVRRSFIEQVGLMQEDYFLYFEEFDWALRGRRRFRLGYAPGAIVLHKEGGTIGSSSDTRRTSTLSDQFMFGNRLRFTRRFFPLALPSVWCVMLLQALVRGLRGQPDRMLLILRILFGQRPRPLQ